MTSVALFNPQQAHKALLSLWPEIKALTMAGNRVRLVLKPETRKDAQSALFHSLIGQISDHIGGDLADKDDAKRILLSAFRIDTLNEFADEWRKFGDLRIGRGLRGETVLMGNQTRDLSVRLAGAFVTWLEAFGVEHGVKFRAPASWGESS